MAGGRPFQHFGPSRRDYQNGSYSDVRKISHFSSHRSLNPNVEECVILAYLYSSRVDNQARLHEVT